MTATSPRRRVSLLLAGLLFAALTAPALAETQWRTCAAGEFQVTAVRLEPDVIVPGTSADFTVDVVGGSDDVASGTINMLVRLMGLPIYTKQDDLCSKTACPVAKGAAAQLLIRQQFPPYTPRGSYSLTLSGKSASGAQLFCVQVSFVVGRPSLRLHRKVIA